jgi:hypothetical protein
MADEKIEFRKLREFGENLNDTFTFIRQNLKPLLLAFFAIGGIFMLAKAILGGIYESRNFGIFDQLRRGGANWGRSRGLSEIFTPEYFGLMIFSWMGFIATRVLLAAYVKFYVENNGTMPNVEQVWSIFKRYFFRVFIYSVPVAMLIGIGCLCCLVPGVYLIVVFVPFDIIVVVEDRSFGDAFGRCFALVKDNFWISFAIYFVAGIIYWFSSMIITVVVGIVVGLSTFFTTKSIGTSAGVVTSFLSVFAGVFYIIFFVSSALQYYNLVETHDGSGLLQRIDSIGGDQHTIDNNPEQY